MAHGERKRYSGRRDGFESPSARGGVGQIDEDHGGHVERQPRLLEHLAPDVDGIVPKVSVRALCARIVEHAEMYDALYEGRLTVAT